LEVAGAASKEMILTTEKKKTQIYRGGVTRAH